MGHTSLWVFGVVVVVMMGCGPSARVPGGEPFSISISTGGGFAGLCEGCRLQSTGTIERWRRIGTRAEEVLWSGEVEVEVAVGWRDRLEGTGALGQVHRQTGNMTTQVTYTRGDTTLNWSWQAATKEDGSPLRAWHSEFAGFCRISSEE